MGAWERFDPRRWRVALVAGLVLALVGYQVAQAFLVCNPMLPLPCINSDGGFVIDDTVSNVLAAVLAWWLSIIGQVIEGFINAVLQWVIDTLPDASPLGSPNFAGVMVGYVWMNQWLPLDAGIAVSGLIFAAMMGRFTIATVAWFWHLIPKPFAGT